ncbi:MAG: hypothetical protein ACI8RD_008001 [Bacillariaceae sp.]|jgi:hypothetical protein
MNILNIDHTGYNIFFLIFYPCFRQILFQHSLAHKFRIEKERKKERKKPHPSLPLVTFKMTKVSSLLLLCFVGLSGGEAAQLGPRPFWLIDNMVPGTLQDELRKFLTLSIQLYHPIYFYLFVIFHMQWYIITNTCLRITVLLLFCSLFVRYTKNSGMCKYN